MQIYSCEDLQNNFDHLFELVQNGQTIMIEDENEKLFALMPYKEYKKSEALSIYFDHNDAC